MVFDICVPILGFEEVKQVELEKIDNLFMRLSSSHSDKISFTLVDPFALRDYDFEVPLNIKELLEIDESSNLLIQNILLVQTPIENSVVNFIAPFVFNTDNQKASQIILSDSKEYEVAEVISKFL